MQGNGRRLLRWGSAAGIALLAHAACAQLPDTLAQALRRTGLPDSAIGLVVQPLDSDSAEVAHNAGEAFNPASVMKLLTTLSALDTLGPSHRFTTRVLVDGNLANGILHGNLILQGLDGLLYGSFDEILELGIGQGDELL